MLEAESVSLLELVEARIQLEVPLAGLAAQNATEETVVELEQAIADAHGHHQASDEFRLADARFHGVIARTAGNELLLAFTSWTLDVLQPMLVARVGGTDRRRPDHPPAPGDPAGDPPAAARGRAASDAPPPRVRARADARRRGGRGVSTADGTAG